MKTIREQILSKLTTTLEEITLSNGYYTNIGQNVVRGRYDVAPDELPAIVVIAETESVIYKDSHLELSIPVTLEAFVHFYTHNPAIEGEKILGDLLVNMLSTRLSLAFHTGSKEPITGHIITGATSNATTVLESVSKSSGSWAVGNAAGTFNIRMPYDDFESEIIKNENGETLAQTTGAVTLIPRLNNLTNSIEYLNGGIVTQPEPGENILKVTAEFTIRYVTLTGNPYKQT